MRIIEAWLRDSRRYGFKTKNECKWLNLQPKCKRIDMNEDMEIFQFKCATWKNITQNIYDKYDIVCDMQDSMTHISQHDQEQDGIYDEIMMHHSQVQIGIYDGCSLLQSCVKENIL